MGTEHSQNHGKLYQSYTQNGAQMSTPIILASGSVIRRELLENAGIPFSVSTAKIDEQAIRASMQANGSSARDIADALAQAKARKISARSPDALVIGCDQVLEFDNRIIGKVADKAGALDLLNTLSGQKHRLLSAVVIFQGGQPQWRFTGKVDMQMRPLSPTYLNDYVARNWPEIRDSVGCYKLEQEGARLFSCIQGDYFTVLGLPLLELIGYLTQRKVLPG